MCLTRDHLKPNVIFFLKYRNKGNKELIQKYAPSSSLAEWRVNSAWESMSSFAFKVLFVVHVTLLHCVFLFLCGEGGTEQIISVYANSNYPRFC